MVAILLDVLKLDYVVSREKALEKKSLKKNLSYQQADGDSNYDKKTFSGLCFSILSDRNFCYISTKEGVLVKVKKPKIFKNFGSCATDH